MYINLSRIPVVIFCGGRGARFDAETLAVPKPLIEVAGKPIIRHIIDSFYAQGFREFILPTGYLGNKVAQFICDLYYERIPDLTVTAYDTGNDASTGERLGRVADKIGDRRFVLTYGDGLSDVRMTEVISLHDETTGTLSNRPLVTMTVVRPPNRFGIIKFHEKMLGYHRSTVQSFDEKPADGWINGGFMVVEPAFIGRYIDHGGFGHEKLEGTALCALASHGLLRAYRHQGYWRCMDTRRDLEQIEEDVRQVGHLPWNYDDGTKGKP